MSAQPLKSSDVLSALRQRYVPKYNFAAPSWVFFEELRVGAGWGKQAEQRIDAWAMNCWPSKREMIAFEVKVSRSDFLREIANPRKRRPALFYSNKFYFVAPEGLIKSDELPVECGLIEIDSEHKAVIKEAAIWRDCHAPSWSFLASIARRAALKEQNDGSR